MKFIAYKGLREMAGCYGMRVSCEGVAMNEALADL